MGLVSEVVDLEQNTNVNSARVTATQTRTDAQVSILCVVVNVIKNDFFEVSLITCFKGRGTRGTGGGGPLGEGAPSPPPPLFSKCEKVPLFLDRLNYQ